jgi:mono/diheme cytochrome c family protein
MYYSLLTKIMLLSLIMGGDSGGGQELSGKHLYEENCARCHGITGHGNAAHFDDPAFQKLLTDAQIKQTIHNGNGNMPAFGNTFNDAQISSLITYLRSLAHPH